MITEENINNQIKDLVAKGKLKAAEHAANYTRDVECLCLFIDAFLKKDNYGKAYELVVKHNILQEVVEQCEIVKRIEKIIDEKNFELAYNIAEQFNVIDEETIINGLVTAIEGMSVSAIFSVRTSVKNKVIKASLNNKLHEEGIGEIVEFGFYQDENIKWRVLDKIGDKKLLISEQAIDCKRFQLKDKDITWEKCDLRKWLNDDFIKEAFNEEEQKRIDITNVCNKDNEYYHTAGGNDTEDKVFLLSIEEVYKYFADDDDRVCKATDHAKKCGVLTNSEGSCEWWWLRSPGYQGNFAASVSGDGDVHAFGGIVSYAHSAVRPAFWLNP